MRGTASKVILFITLLLVFICCSQEKNRWTQTEYPMMEHKTSKWDENIRYTFSNRINIEDREKTIAKSKEYIEDNLRIIKESVLNDSIEIIFVDDKEEMYKYTYLHLSGTVFFLGSKTNNLVFCIYDNKRMPLKHELMHLVAGLKWGLIDGDFSWFDEGLATYADSDWECDSYSFEEKYTAFMQDNKLVPMDSLITDFHGDIFTKDFDNNINRIRYNQSAYMVQYMIENYGIEKIKELWQNGMHKFEDIFGVTIYTMVDDIEKKLREKYPEPIEFDWKKFEERCY